MPYLLMSLTILIGIMLPVAHMLGLMLALTNSNIVTALTTALSFFYADSGRVVLWAWQVVPFCFLALVILTRLSRKLGADGHDRLAAYPVCIAWIGTIILSLRIYLEPYYDCGVSPFSGSPSAYYLPPFFLILATLLLYGFSAFCMGLFARWFRPPSPLMRP